MNLYDWALSRVRKETLKEFSAGLVYCLVEIRDLRSFLEILSEGYLPYLPYLAYLGSFPSFPLISYRDYTTCEAPP